MSTGTRAGSLLRSAAARAVIGAALVLSAAAGAGAASFGDISVLVQPVPAPSSSANTTHGYMEYRLEVTNHSTTRKHTVELTIPRDTGRRGDYYIRRISRTVNVTPGSTVVVSLFQPALPMGGDDLGVAVDGKGSDRAVSLGGSTHGRSLYRRWTGRSSATCMLVSRNVSNEFRDLADSSGATCFRAELPCRRWSANWLGYSRYDGVVVAAGDIDAMTPPVAQALRRYVECGGSVLVVGAVTVPDVFRPAGAKPGQNSYYLGLGRCMAIRQARKGPTWEVVQSMWSRSFMPFSRTLDPGEANNAFPVVEKVGVPVRGMLTLIVVFAFMIGPVNIYLLSRWKRRIWMLWIVPAVSLLTCGGVFAYSALAEGWHGHCRTEALTILDEQSHRATTIGWTAYYCPLTPGGGLKFDTETELTAQIDQDYRRGRRPSGSGSIDWTADQHFDSGWVKARVPAHFKLRKSEVRRERLNVVGKAADGTPTVVNGLGAPVQRLWLADDQGRIWHTGKIAAGAEARLSLLPTAQAKAGEDALRSIYAKDWLWVVRDIANRPAEHLRPGCYVAVMNDCPFVKQGLGKLKTRKCKTVVYGIMKKGEDGS